MKTMIINVRSGIEYDVYIGRPGRGKSGEFGNPHTLGFCRVCDQVHRDKGDASAAFAEDFYFQIQHDPVYRQKIEALRGKVLGCFCDDKNTCHGRVYVEWLERK